MNLYADSITLISSTIETALGQNSFARKLATHMTLMN